MEVCRSRWNLEEPFRALKTFLNTFFFLEPDRDLGSHGSIDVLMVLQGSRFNFSKEFHKVLQECCGVLRCATWFSKGSEKVRVCKIQRTQKNFHWLYKDSRTHQPHGP